MENKISIIVPIYQAEQWLDNCLESLVNQSYKNLEIILVNDGSTDNSGLICEEYASKDKRIKVIYQNNSGVSKARNSGLKIATGKYIQFVDSDDWLDKDMCKSLLSMIINQNVDLVLCGMNITKNGKILRTPHLPNKVINIKQSQEAYWFLRKINLGPCNKLYKKNYIYSGFNENITLGEDSLFIWEYMRGINYVGVVENCLYNVRLDNDNSLNRMARKDRLELVLNLRNKEMEFIEELYGKASNKMLIYNEYILTLHAAFREQVEQLDIKQGYEYIKKYILKKEFKIAAKNSEFKRFDYKVFNYLVRFNCVFCIYLFFKIKSILIR